MPIYLFSVMATPKAVLKDIQNIQRKFLWEATQINTNGYWSNGTRSASPTLLVIGAGDQRSVEEQ